MLTLYMSMCASDEEQQRIAYIYEHYYDLMYRAVYQVVQDENVTPDIVHDTMLRLIKSNQTQHVRNGAVLQTYVCIVARNTALEHLRLHDKKVTSDIEAASADADMENPVFCVSDIMIRKEKYNRLVQCIMELPEVLKDACYLRYVCNLSDQEIAPILNIPAQSVAMRVCRGRKILQDKIEEVRRNEK